MKYCTSEECSGLDPCEACTKIRRAVLMRAVHGAGLSKDQAEKFFRSYAESFDSVMSEVRKLAEEAGRKRLEEKEAREKVKLIDKVSRYPKEGREEKQAGPSKVAPPKEKHFSTKEKLMRSSTYGKNGSGEAVVVENSKSEHSSEVQPPKE